MTNTQNLVIFSEKPSQALAYSKAYSVKERTKHYIVLNPDETFPDGATITWGIGHLVGLKMPGDYKEEWKRWSLDNLPIFPKEHQYMVSKDKETQYKVVKGLFEKANTIINACDIDREGSNIFYSTYYMTGVSGKIIKRLWINSLEVDEIRKGFKNLLSNEKDLLMYQEANARQIGDWLVGINMSPLFSLSTDSKISIGRVQTPTCFMIYERQKEIENFKPENFYEVYADFKTDGKGSYTAKAKLKEKDKNTLSSLLEKQNIVIDNFNEGLIKSVTKQEKKQSSPRLHSLSTIQTVANKKWKYSPDTVLKTMQSLYEKKLVTYPRTSCNFITENEFEYLKTKVEGYQSVLNVSFEADLKPKKRYVDGSKVQEHFALIPTKQIPNEATLKGLSETEFNLYQEVLKNTLAMFHQDYLYEETEIVTEVKDIDFFVKGKVEVNKGWKALFSSDTKDTKDTKDTEEATLPNVEKGEKVIGEVHIQEGVTKPKKPYTEGQLINLMKTAGNSSDDEDEKEILKEVEGIGTEATRSGIIETIKKNGYIEVKKNIVYVTPKGEMLCKAVEGTLLASPSMTAKWEQYLKKIGRGEGTKDNFLKNIEKFILSMIDRIPKELAENKEVQALQSEINEVEVIGKCPKCTNGDIVDKKALYGCTNYKQGCEFAIFKKIASKTLSKKNVKDLLEKGKTAKIKGFTSKKKKKFDAVLILNEEGKVTFSFD